MKLSIYSGVLLFIMTGLSITGYGQEGVKKESVTHRQTLEQRKLYSQILQVDSVKAEQVSQAQLTYKDSLKLVLADTTLNDGAKRSKINSLMEVKKQKLKRVLNEAQLKKLIPSTERKTANEGLSLKDNQSNK